MSHVSGAFTDNPRRHQLVIAPERPVHHQAVTGRQIRSQMRFDLAQSRSIKQALAGAQIRHLQANVIASMRRLPMWREGRGLAMQGHSREAQGFGTAYRKMRAGLHWHWMPVDAAIMF